MFNFTEPHELNTVIDQLVTNLANGEPGSKEYSILADQLTKLYKLKEIDIKLLLQQIETHNKTEALEAEARIKDLEAQAMEQERRLFGIKVETLALIGANLIGIGLILSHERLNVVTTKALGFVSKLK